jgi:hypothetical protein
VTLSSSYITATGGLIIRRPPTLGANTFVSPGQVVERAIRLAAAHIDDQVSVAEPDGLTTMVSLCREGFDSVECARRATCAGADEESDVLLIVGAMTGVEVADTVRRTARLVRDGGRLVVQLARTADAAGVRDALASMRLDITSTIIDRSCGRLVAYTLRRASGASAPASPVVTIVGGATTRLSPRTSSRPPLSSRGAG